MGVVYLAHDPALGREVAVKIVSPAALNPQTAERLRREARVVARMDHPSIVPVYDLGEHEGALFFVMPVVRGTTLRQRMKAGDLCLADVLEVGSQVARALHYSHQLEVLHRDVKPENIMLVRDESGETRVRIMDFGLALHSPEGSLQSPEQRLTRSGAVMGTSLYLAPEQLRDQSVDARSDLYSLGTVLYECLAGEPPFRGALPGILYRVAYELPRSLRSLGVEVPVALEELVLRCMAKEPRERPASGVELAETLERLRADLGDSAKRAPTRSEKLPAPAPAEVLFTNREREFAGLQERLTRAAQGECQLALIAGDIGVGKSRLLRELERLARARGMQVLFGRCVDHEQGLALYGFCDLILDFFRHGEGETPSEGWPDFTDLREDLVRRFPMLGEIKRLRGTESTRIAESPLARGGEEKLDVFELLSRTLLRIIGGRPSVFLLEELHLAGISIEALQYVVRRLGAAPCMIVGTYLPHAVERTHPLARLLESFRGAPGFLRLDLRSFAPAAHRAFVGHLLGEEHVSGELVRELFEATDGNPFFTQELVHALLTSGSISKDESGAWHVAAAREIRSDELPGTIQQAVEKRIHGLPDELRELLASASVLGKAFEVRDLAFLIQDEHKAEEGVDRLLDLGLLEEQHGSRRDRVAFVSGVLRDLVNGQLTRRARRSLHRRWAEELERRHAGRLDRVRAQLLLHYAQADLGEKVLEHGPAAIRLALDAFSPEEAVRSAETVLDFLDERGAPGRAALEGDVRLLLSEAQRLLRNSETALKQAGLAARLFEEAARPERAVDAMLLAAETAWEARNIDEAQRWLEAGLETARRAGEREHQRRLLELGATLANLRGEYARGLEYMRAAEELCGGTSREDGLQDTSTMLVYGGRLVVGLGLRVRTLDPALACMNEETEVVGNVFENLIVADERGNLEPWLAQAWKVEDGGRAFEFELRPNVLFHDGAPLTALAVKECFERALRAPDARRLPAFASLAGLARAESGGEIEGLRVLGERRLRIELERAMFVFPALLTAHQCMLARGAANGALVGTGPFLLQGDFSAALEGEALVLTSNRRYWNGPPHVAELEFRMDVGSAEAVEGLRRGELDVVQRLAPEDLEALLAESRFRSSFVEAPRRAVYFVLFNELGPAAADPALRQVLAGALRVDELVWTHLGRRAQPASSFLPPGILGHDPGRRKPQLTAEEARALLAEAGCELPLELTAAVNPVYFEAFRPLWEAVQAAWAELGVRVRVVTDSMGSFQRAWTENEEIDLLVGRWIADYNDPDDFTYGLFHREHGLLRRYFSSAGADELSERARSESAPEIRLALYRRFERLAAAAHALVPLFYDYDYRVAGSRVRRLELLGRSPWVNYTRIEAVKQARRSVTRGREAVRVACAEELVELEPARVRGTLACDVLPLVFETLTRVGEGAKVIPWLAREIHEEDGGRTYRLALRADARFHDGRPLTARDVRYSWERVLRAGECGAHALAPIRGARAFARGERDDVEGLHLFSADELLVELERPVGIFPQLLSHPALAIQPEGSDRPGALPRERWLGTGPFRVEGFRPGEKLDLIANRAYWRRGRPRAPRLDFHFRVNDRTRLEGLRSGRYSIAGDLESHELESLRREARFAHGYREVPRPTTVFLALNARSGPLAKLEHRRSLLAALDLAHVARTAQLRQVVPAGSLIPPGLIGHDPTRRPAGAREAPQRTDRLELRAALWSDGSARLARLADALIASLAARGTRVKIVNDGGEAFFRVLAEGEADLAVCRWTAEYPDGDAFAHGLFDPDFGLLRWFGTADLARRIAAARGEGDPLARDLAFREFEEHLEREALLVPIFHEPFARICGAGVDKLRLALFPPGMALDEVELREPAGP
jgi:ABC-type transport system substrate-binding protein